MNTITRRQAAVLDFIERRRIAPTIREIGNALGIRSTNGVSDHLEALERKGRIVYGAREKARQIQVVQPLTVEERERYQLGEGSRRCPTCRQVVEESPTRPSGGFGGASGLDPRLGWRSGLPAR